MSGRALTCSILIRSSIRRILIPRAVDKELTKLMQVAPSQAIQKAKSEGWLEVVDEVRSPLIRLFEEQLDPGEASAIAVALERSADLLLIDEADGREVATVAWLRVRGVLGILRLAKEAGELSSLRDELRKLRDDPHFFVSPRLTERFLAASGED